MHEAIIKIDFHISLDIILVKRKTFGHTDFSSNSTKSISTNCLSGLKKEIVED